MHGMRTQCQAATRCATQVCSSGSRAVQRCWRLRFRVGPCCTCVYVRDTCVFVRNTLWLGAHSQCSAQGACLVLLHAKESRQAAVAGMQRHHASGRSTCRARQQAAPRSATVRCILPASSARRPTHAGKTACSRTASSERATTRAAQRCAAASLPVALVTTGLHTRGLHQAIHKGCSGTGE